MALTIAIGVACFGFGIVVGMILDYKGPYSYLKRRNEELVQHILTMRKQGFVPQFEIQQRRSPDPSEDIHEF